MCGTTMTERYLVVTRRLGFRGSYLCVAPQEQGKEAIGLTRDGLGRQLETSLKRGLIRTIAYSDNLFSDWCANSDVHTAR